jgi:hypothetical protein
VLTRSLAGVGGVWGFALLIRPRRAVAALSPQFPESRVWVVRALGARLVAQHAIVLVAPRTSVVRTAAAVDAVHAASMVPLLAFPRYRRAALISGGVAATWAALAATVAGGAGRR